MADTNQATEALTADQLDDIEELARMAVYDDHEAREIVKYEVPRLVAEVRRLREQREAGIALYHDAVRRSMMLFGGQMRPGPIDADMLREALGAEVVEPPDLTMSPEELEEMRQQIAEIQRQHAALKGAGRG